MRRILVIIVLFMLCGVAPVAAQRVVVPDYLELSKEERQQMQKFCDKLSKPEKLLLMTVDSLTRYYRVDFPWAVEQIKNYKAFKNGNAHHTYDETSNIIDAQNGYLFLGNYDRSVALTYWNMNDGRQLVGVNFVMGLCCSSREHEDPVFFILDSAKQLTYKPTKEVLDSPVKWYDLFTFEEYITADYNDFGMGWSYNLPRTGKDIIINHCGGCGSQSASKEIRYKYNGDGTFTLTPNIAKQLNNGEEPYIVD